jgi:hypothetical protein
MYYKFLRAGAVSPFQGFQWVRSGRRAAGEWVEASSAPHLCRSGIHACRVGDLPYWLNEELWSVEFDGEVVETELKVVGERARLLDRVAEWDQAADRKFAMACAVRAAIHAADELREADLAGLGERLAHVALAAGEAIEVRDDPDKALLGPVETVATEGLEESARLGRKRPANLCGYVTDAIGYVGEYSTASVAYIAARAVDGRSSTHTDDPFAEERGWQARWLGEHLGLGPIS